MNNQEIWRTFCSKNEYRAKYKDKYDRFPYFLSNNDPLKANVSEYLVEEGLKINYPDNRKFAALISHDIDYLYKPKWTLKTLLNQQFIALSKANFKKFILNFDNLKRRISSNLSIDNILRIHDKYGINSIFYFLALSKEEQDFNYNLNEISQFKDVLIKRGDQIGLHGGHKAYASRSKILQEKKYLESTFEIEVNSYRNHYLHFDISSTWKNLIHSGFKVDSTFGYSKVPGFRNGMCHPFTPYSLTESRFLDIVEIPLMIMDTTLFKHLQLEGDNAFNLIKDIIDYVKSLNGVVTILWHNESFIGDSLEIYEKVLDYLVEQNCWITTENHLLKHYRTNKYFEEMNRIIDNLFPSP
ncbi:MAG: hypothetical protein CL837_07930 [Crocinitomicaceae bacterium]|nr:hypothetical protein [Crocinitomicaceae bacterium]